MRDEADQNWVGETLDARYRLDGILGQGGMGLVYEATQLSVGRRVAIKTIRTDIDSRTVEGRFMHEARIIAQINHPNVVQLYDYGRDPERGVLFLVMEFVEGVPLATLVRRSAVRLPLALEVIRQACSGLAEAHSRGVVHRDIKPENVMLSTTAEGAIHTRVLDFGIALAVAADTRMTATGAITGTPHYMSPEQAQDQPVEPTSDVYALGIMLYEMLCGELPFTADTPLALLLKHVQEPPPSISERVPNLAPAVSTLVDRMLVKDPNTRIQSVAEIGHTIDRIRRELDLPRVTIDATKNGVAAFEPWLSGSFSVLDEDVFGETMESPVARSPAAVEAAEPETSTVPPRQVLDGPRNTLSPGSLVLIMFGAVVVLGIAIVAVVSNSREDAPAAPPPALVSPAPPKDIDLVVPTVLETVSEARIIVRTSAADAVSTATRQKKPARVAGPKLKRKTKSVKRVQPERKVAPPIDDATLAMRRRVAGGTCTGTQTCVFETTELPGHVACLGQSTCKADCIIGGCQQFCFDESTCTFRCTGGGCKRMASPEASMTELD